MHEINRAMQVLEIQSQLNEQDRDKNEQLKDKEVAVLREMCNVSLVQRNANGKKYIFGPFLYNTCTVLSRQTIR